MAFLPGVGDTTAGMGERRERRVGVGESGEGVVDREEGMGEKTER